MDPFNEKGYTDNGALGSYRNPSDPTVVTPAPVAPVAPKAPAASVTTASGGLTQEQVLANLAKYYEGVKSQASNIAATQGTSDSSVVASSTATRNSENQTRSQVQAKIAESQPRDDGTGAMRTASDAYISGIDQQIAQLEARRQADISGINAGFDSTKKELEGKQANETGSTTVSLARIGGYLGGTASGTGAMLNLAQTHKNEVLSLEAKRAAAINEANNAITDKQFQLAQAKLKEAKDIELEVQDRKDKFFDQNLKVIQEQRQQDEFLRDKYKDELETLATLGTETDPAKMQEIDDYYGVDGFAARYMEVNNAVAKAKNEKEATASRQALLSFLKDIPQGQTIRFPDGTEYTGMGSAGDISTSIQTDTDGNSHMVAYNKLTGQTSVTNLGPVGKGGGSSNNPASVDPVVRDNARTMMQIRLEEGKLKDGTYDPDVYVRERKLLKEAYPQLLETMDKLFLNKEYGFFNEDAISRLRKKGIYVGDQPALSYEEIQAANSETE